MEFSIRSATDNARSKITSFYGLNRKHKGAWGEAGDMLNMSGDEFPCLSPRKGRLAVASSNTPINAVAAPDKTNTDTVSGLTGVTGGGFYYNGVLKSDKTVLSPEWAWQIERMGNLYIINGYDREKKQSETYYYNIDTDKFSQKGVMKNLIVTCNANTITLLSINKNGADNYSITTPDGEVISNKDYFDTYCKSGVYTPTSENLFEKHGFAVGDEITIEGFPKTGNDCPGQIWYFYGSDIKARDFMSTEFNNTVDTDEMTNTDSLSKHANVSAFIAGITTTEYTNNGLTYAAHSIRLSLYTKDGSAGMLDSLATETVGACYCSGITIRKKRRNFTNITTHHGRVWGSVPSGNTLYASSSDDIASFTSNDITKCYGARLVSDTAGRFTALCSFNNELVAFKPDSITIVSGTGPKNYYTNVLDGVGCISGKSVSVTPQGIIFLGHKGFYIFDGSVPRLLSEKLNSRYSDAVSGFDGEVYYAAATRADGARELLKYDLRRGLWHKEDDISAIGFFRFGADFFIADKNNIYALTDDKSDVDWSFTLRRTHEDMLDSKGINEIWIRAYLKDGASFKVLTAVGGGEFKEHTAFSKQGLNICRCPVRLVMGEDYTIKLSGRGEAVIYELEMVSYSGGRKYKEDN